MQALVPPTMASPPPQANQDETDLLLTFVHDRDVACPRCDYNLRNLTKPVCPECQEPLRLVVGVQRLRYEWLIAALAPGIFSGIAAFFLACMLIMVNLSPTGRVPWQPYVIDSFGWLSAVFTIALFRRRHWFLRQSQEVQIGIASAFWFVHIVFFFSMWAMMR